MAFYKATMEDLNMVVKTIRDNIETRYAKEYDAETVEFLIKKYAKINIREMINNDMVVIQTEAENPMGIGCLSYDAIRLICIAPGYQKQGSGERLIRKLEEMARDNGQRSLRVEVPEISKGFFLYEGYESTGKREYPVENGKPFVCDVMEKEI